MTLCGERPGVCYLCVCLLVYVAEARQCPCSLGNKPFETRNLLPYNVRCGELSYLWSDHGIDWENACQSKTTQPNRVFWYQFTPRKLLYHMILVNLVTFGPLGLSVFFGPPCIRIYTLSVVKACSLHNSSLLITSTALGAMPLSSPPPFYFYFYKCLYTSHIEATSLVEGNKCYFELELGSGAPYKEQINK